MQNGWHWKAAATAASLVWQVGIVVSWTAKGLMQIVVDVSEHQQKSHMLLMMV